MVERFRPTLPEPPAKPVAKPARFIPNLAPAPTPDPAALPFQVGDYLDVNLTNTPVGSGQRYFLIIHVYPRKREVRLFHVPTLEAFDIDMGILGRNKTMRKMTDAYHSRLAKRIRVHKNEHKTLGMRITSDTDLALAALKENGHDHQH